MAHPAARPRRLWPCFGRCLRLLTCGWFSLASFVTAADAWHRDFDAAIARASETGRENLVIFTGLEWEEWSGKLREEVLAKPEFHERLRDDFVLTHIDLPETPGAVEALTDSEARSHGVARDFRLHVLPSIYLCTASGQPYGLVGYRDGGADALVAAIHGKRAAYADAMRAIEGLEGPARARAIDAWLQSIPEPLRPLHRDKIDRIIVADPDDTTGLRSKHLLALMIPEARQLRYANRLEESEARYHRILREVKPTGEALQQIHYEVADIHFQRKDYDRLLDTLDAAIAAAPEGERMSVLREMMDVFTRQWILTRHKPDEMRAADYDHRRIVLGPGDVVELRELVAEAKRITPGSARNQILDRMARELADGDFGDARTSSEAGKSSAKE